MRREIPQHITHFDELPDSALVSLQVVEWLYSVSGPTVWRWVREGIIPKPVKLTASVTRWQVGELRASLAARKEAWLKRYQNTGDGG